MNGRVRLGKFGKGIFLDSMCFIYLFEANKSYGGVVKKIFDELTEKRLKAYTSSLTLAEILAQPRIILDKLLVSNYKSLFLTTPNLVINYNFSVELLEKAAEFKVKYNLKLPDAIQLATCFLFECQVFITNDTKLKKVKEFKVLLLKDLF